MAPPTPKAPTLEELYPGINTAGKSDAEKDAELAQTYPGMAQEPTMGEAAKETLLGAGQGLVRTSPMVGGAYMGLKAGAPFFPPYGAIGGMILGGATGFFAGRQAEQLFPGVSREDLAPYREGGKTFGDSIAFAPTAFGIPQMTANRVARFVSGIGDAARRNPKAFLLAETSAAGGAGVGGGLAEAYDPGAAGTRFGAEVVGGLFSPGRLLINGTTTAADFVGKMRSTVSQSGREARAANRLYTILTEAGEDVPRLIRELERPLPGGVTTPTSAQKTGSVALSELETTLGKAHARFMGESMEQGRQAMRAYQLLADRLKDIGTPDALRKAAELRETAFNQMLAGRLAAADATAADKIRLISRDTPQARRQIGEIVKTETENALRSARDYESSLWQAGLAQLTRPSRTTVTSAVPTGIVDAAGQPITRQVTQDVIQAPRLAPSRTVQDFLQRTLEIGDAVYTNTMPKVVKDIMADFGVTDDVVRKYKLGKNTQEFMDTGAVPARFLPKAKEVDIAELINYRSNLLKLSREAAGAGEVANADFYSTLAEGMLRDLEGVKNPAFDSARQFSKALNDTFTRTFAKTASETGDLTRAGAQRIPAETLVLRAFGSNADVTAQRMTEIEDAVKFMAAQYDNAVAQFGAGSPQALALKPQADMARSRVSSITDAQARALRLMAAKAVDPATGRLNVRQLEGFIAQNKPMLDKMGITGDLRNATTAENALRATQEQNSFINRTLRNQTAFAQLLKFENPTTAVSEALNSRFPVKNVSNMAKLAAAGGQDAINGLKSTLYDYAYTRAGGNSGNFNIQAFDDALFKPIAPNQPSLINIMRANNLMTLTEVKNLRQLINPMVRIEEAMGNKRVLDNVVEGADAVSELAMRVIGSRIGTAAAPSGPGSLIAASAGSKAVRQLFDKMPTMFTRGIIEQAAQDPQFMALLLRRGTTEREKLNIARSLHSYMLMSGLNYATYEEPQPTPQAGTQPPFTQQGQAARALRQMPPAPSTRGVPFMQQGGPGQPPKAGGGGGGAPTPPAPGGAASMLQQLFPFDSISGLAAGRQQPPPQ
jgi:hypothetical protein